ASATFTVDTTPPVVTLTTPANGSGTNLTTPTFSGTAGTAPWDSAAVTVELYAGSTASGSPVQTLKATASSGAWSIAATTALPDGTYTAQATQTDEVGNIGASTSSTFTIQSPGIGDSSPVLKTAPDTTMPSVEPRVTLAAATQAVLPDATSGAVVDDPKCATNTLPANDDGSTGQVALPFTLDFYGRSYSDLWVNNNGNVTFSGSLATYTPFSFTATTPPIIAPFFADVDTRGPGSGLVTYGNTTYEGHTAFCVDWPNVGYYYAHTDKLDDFQLLLVSRSDIAPGDFDIIFNYDRIAWETGDASGGSNGFGGASAGVGFANGDGNSTHFYSLPGTLQNGAFLDSNTLTGLVHGDHGSTVPGRYVFPIVTGNPVTTGRYVALGDSIPYGHGLANPKDNDPPSTGAYPQYVDKALGLLPLNYRKLDCALYSPTGLPYDQLAVSGAPSQPSQWVSGDSTCGDSVMSELEQAQLTKFPPALVTLQVGADDVDFGACLTWALTEPIPIPGGQKCVNGSDPTNFSLTPRVSSELGTLYSGITNIINTIHREAPGAQIVVLDYYQPIPQANAVLNGTSVICKDIRFSSQGGDWRTYIRDIADYLQGRLNNTVRTAAQQFPDVAFVDLASLMSGHEMCTPNTWLYSDTWNAAHPTAPGQQQIANAVVDVCDRRPTRCAGR
ncbi:MAG TPA: nidogen-like domain-containing protein, partial [Mycobacterium sp.]|nr:nidogen-like domain-containing protein [Mycobacterium sp.]